MFTSFSLQLQILGERSVNADEPFMNDARALFELLVSDACLHPCGVVAGSIHSSLIRGAEKAQDVSTHMYTKLVVSEPLSSSSLSTNILRGFMYTGPTWIREFQRADPNLAQRHSQETRKTSYGGTRNGPRQ